MKNKAIFLFSVLFGLTTTGFSLDTLKLTRLFNFIRQEDAAMGSFSISKCGDEIYSKSIGYSNVEKGIKNHNESEFKIGSISKPFTAVIIFQLIDEELLTLDSKLSEFFPKLPNAQKITVKHLLGHQSGLKNFTNSEWFWDYRTKGISKEAFFGHLEGEESSFEPGTQTVYCNTNFYLLSCIAEELKEGSFEEQVNSKIIQPLKLSNTFCAFSSKPENMTKSYQKYGTWQPYVETDMSLIKGAGAIISTPKDVNKFLYSLMTKDLISNASRDSMLTNNLGIFKSNANKKIIYAHTGQIDGFHSASIYIPEDSVAVSYFSNGSDLAGEKLIESIFYNYLKDSYKEPKLVKTSNLPPNQNFIGRYHNEEFKTYLDIKVVHNAIELKVEGQPECAFRAMNKNKFYCGTIDCYLIFNGNEVKLKESDGKTVWVKRE